MALRNLALGLDLTIRAHRAGKVAIADALSSCWDRKGGHRGLARSAGKTTQQMGPRLLVLMRSHCNGTTATVRDLILPSSLDASCDILRKKTKAYFLMMEDWSTRALEAHVSQGSRNTVASTLQRF